MARNVLADIDAAVSDLQAERRVTWFDKLPEDVQAVLLAAREKFHAGGYGTTKRLTLGRVLMQYCQGHGHHACDYKRMGEWLARKD